MSLSQEEEKALDTVERKFGINFRTASPDRIFMLFQQEGFRKMFDEDKQDDFSHLLSGMGKVIEDTETKDTITASYLLHQLILSRTRIMSYYDSYEDGAMTRDELIAAMDAEIGSAEEVPALNAILLNYESALDLKISSEKLVDILKSLEAKISAIKTTKHTYYQKAMLIDFICSALDAYFRAEGVKICQDNPDIWAWVKAEIAELQRVEDTEFHRLSEFDLPEDSHVPEELGLLDITKLRKQGEKNED